MNYDISEDPIKDGDIIVDINLGVIDKCIHKGEGNYMIVENGMLGRGDVVRVSRYKKIDVK